MYTLWAKDANVSAIIVTVKNDTTLKYSVVYVTRFIKYTQASLRKSDTCV